MKTICVDYSLPCKNVDGKLLSKTVLNPPQCPNTVITELSSAPAFLRFKDNTINGVYYPTGVVILNDLVAANLDTSFSFVFDIVFSRFKADVPNVIFSTIFGDGQEVPGYYFSGVDINSPFYKDVQGRVLEITASDYGFDFAIGKSSCATEAMNLVIDLNYHVAVRYDYETGIGSILLLFTDTTGEKFKVYPCSNSLTRVIGGRRDMLLLGNSILSSGVYSYAGFQGDINHIALYSEYITDAAARIVYGGGSLVNDQNVAVTSNSVKLLPSDVTKCTSDVIPPFFFWRYEVPCKTDSVSALDKCYKYGAGFPNDLQARTKYQLRASWDHYRTVDVGNTAYTEAQGNAKVYIVPDGVTELTVRLWGGGGGSTPAAALNPAFRGFYQGCSANGWIQRGPTGLGCFLEGSLLSVTTLIFIKKFIVPVEDMVLGKV